MLSQLKVKLQFTVFYFGISAKRTLLSAIKQILWSCDKDCTGIKTIVVLKVGGLGDFTFGIPALNLLRKNKPDANIILLTTQSLNSLGFSYSGRRPTDLSDLPWVSLVRNNVDQVLSVPDLSIRSILKLRSLLPSSEKKAIFILGYPGMTLTSILPKIAFSRLLTKQSDTCFGIDKDRDWKFMRRFQIKHKMTKHKMLGDIDSILEGFPKATFTLEDIDFSVSIAQDTVRQACSKACIGKVEDLVLIAPLATTRHKQWPVENFIQIAKRMAQKDRLIYFALIGTPEHYAVLNELFIERAFKTTNLCGKLTIDELAALLSVSKGYIGNDGGMSQLAGVVGCPSVIVFNSVEEDWLTYPWRSSNGIVRNHTICSPCLSDLHCPQKHHKCVDEISVDAVYSKVEQIIFT